MLDATNRAELMLAMAKIGVTVPLPEEVQWPVFEGDYIKFMGGEIYDKAAGDQLELWMRSHDYSYERNRERSIRHIDRRAVVRIAEAFGLTSDEILENFHMSSCGDDVAWYLHQLVGVGDFVTQPQWSAPVVTPTPPVG